MGACITRADRVARLFCNVVEDIITARAIERCGDGNLSRAQFCGLQYVSLHPGCCIKDLASGLNVSHPAAVKLVERLEAKAFITRASHERDRRIVQLLVTSHGQELADDVMGARSEAVEQIISDAGQGCTCDIVGCLEAFVRVALANEKDMNGVCLRCGGGHDDECPVCATEHALTGQMRTDS